MKKPSEEVKSLMVDDTAITLPVDPTESLGQSIIAILVHPGPQSPLLEPFTPCRPHAVPRKAQCAHYHLQLLQFCFSFPDGFSEE